MGIKVDMRRAVADGVGRDEVVDSWCVFDVSSAVSRKPRSVDDPHFVTNCPKEGNHRW